MRKMMFTVVLGLFGSAAMAFAGCATEISDTETGAEQPLHAYGTPLALDCAALCAASAAMPCETYEACYDECTYVDPVRPECMKVYGDFVDCGANGGPEALGCADGVSYITSAVCGAQWDAVRECQAGPVPLGIKGICRAECKRLAELECAMPLEDCYAECNFWTDYGLPCALEFQKVTICNANSVPEGFVCEEGLPFPLAIGCLEENEALLACWTNYGVN